MFRALKTIISKTPNLLYINNTSCSLTKISEMPTKPQELSAMILDFEVLDNCLIACSPPPNSFIEPTQGIYSMAKYHE